MQRIQPVGQCKMAENDATHWGVRADSKEHPRKSSERLIFTAIWRQGAMNAPKSSAMCISNLFTCTHLSHLLCRNIAFFLFTFQESKRIFLARCKNSAVPFVIIYASVCDNQSLQYVQWVHFFCINSQTKRRQKKKINSYRFACSNRVGFMSIFPLYSG